MAQIPSKYGNVTLGQIAHFLVQLCGKDALLDMGIFTDSEINDAYKEKGSYLKFRYTDENSLFGKIRKFFKELETEFDIPVKKGIRKKSLDGKYFEEVALSDFQWFYSHIVWHYVIQICGTRPFDNFQNNLSKKILYDYLLKQPDSYIPDYINFCSTLTFGELIESFVKDENFTYEEFYSLIEKSLPSDDKDDRGEYVKKALQKSRKENTNPAWKVFYSLVRTVKKYSKEYVSLFLNYYFYRNFKTAIGWISITKTDLYNLENFCSNYDANKVFSFIDENVSMDKIKTIVKYGNFFDSISSKNTESNLNIYQENMNNIRNDIPHSISFWEYWFCAKDFVFHYLNSGNLADLHKAVEWYQRAFNIGKYFMGKDSEGFIHEAIVVSIYYDMKNDPKNARTRIQKCSLCNTETKTPLDRITKDFYDFGIAFDLLLGEANEATTLFYQCYNNFWCYFIPETECAKKIKEDDLFQNANIEPVGISEEDSIFKTRETLLNISDKRINNILPTTHNVAYTPISTAIMQEFLDIVEIYLDKQKYPSLNLNVPNTNNCYPIHELITKYINGRGDKTKEKELILRILERTEKRSLFTQTNRQRFSPLQIAIESLDLDINKEFLKKMFENQKIPDDFLISPDEVSPLYYSIITKHRLTNLNSFQKNRDIGNINYKNLFAPGLSDSEKEKFDTTSVYMDKLLKAIEDIESHIPKDELAEINRQINKKVDDIIDLYIENTDNIDGFISYSMRDPLINNQGCTVLLYACEINDVELCRKLVKNGANINRIVGKVETLKNPDRSIMWMPNNFIQRCFGFCSWDCLEFYLKENKSEASENMHRKDFNMTYMVAFLIQMLDEIQKNPSVRNDNINLIRRFVPLFLNAGASLQEPTIWGSAEQILMQYNLMNCWL